MRIWLTAFLLSSCGARVRVDHSLPVSVPSSTPPSSYAPPAGEPVYCFPGRLTDGGEHVEFCAKTIATCKEALGLVVAHGGGNVDEVGDCDSARVW